MADEPTGALDSKTSDEILDLFKDLHRAGRTIAIVRHSLEVAQSAQRRITLHDARIVADERAGDMSALAMCAGGAGMNPVLGLRTTWRSLRVNKMWSLLTVLGVIVGATAVVCIVSIGLGAQAQVAKKKSRCSPPISW